jgi:hypothetical protein
MHPLKAGAAVGRESGLTTFARRRKLARFSVIESGGKND